MNKKKREVTMCTKEAMRYLLGSINTAEDWLWLHVGNVHE